MREIREEYFYPDIPWIPILFVTVSSGVVSQVAGTIMHCLLVISDKNIQ